MVNSINTNIAAYYAQSNISIASQNTSTSVARLSSGNRIVRASDDVAALSAGTGLRTNVTTLRTALINASQASSLLQVADGALSQITDILQRQKAIAVQAGSGSLDSSARSYLNQEFQNLTQEIDRITGNTNFNGVQLLNGDLFDVTSVDSKTDKATASIGRLTLDQNIANVATSNLIINGQTITIGTNGSTNVARGNTLADTLNNLKNYLNSSTNTSLSKAVYEVQGNSLVINSRAGGSLGNSFTIENSIDRSTALSNTGASGGVRIGRADGVKSGYAYQQIWGFTLASSTTGSAVTTAGGAGVMQAGNFGVTNNAGTTTNITLTNGMTLQDAIDAINQQSGTTGVTAKLIGASNFYGIQLETSTQRSIAAAPTLAASTNLTVTETTGSVQLRSDSVTIADLRTSDLDTAGIFTKSAALTINGTAGTALDGTPTLNEVLDQIKADFGSSGSKAAYGITATVEWDAANSGKYYIVLSSNVQDYIRMGAAGAAVGTNNLDANTATQQVNSSGGVDNGLNIGSVMATGTAGDSILNTLSNIRSSATLSFADLSDANQLANLARKQIQFDTGDGLAAQLTTFKFSDGTTTGQAVTTYDDNIVKIGTTLNDTLDNLVAAINKYADSGEIDAYAISKVTARREGRNVILEYQSAGNLTARGSATALKLYTNISQTDAGLSSASTVTGFDGGATNQVTTFNNGAATGVDASNIVNKDFAGTLSGFNATYTGTNNQVNLSVTVGSETYTATGVNTKPTSTTTVRFISATGGYFDVQLAANQGADVTNQTDADRIASRLDQAFSTIKFYQNRSVSSYNAAGDIITNNSVSGSLTGTTLSLSRSDFGTVTLDDVSVSAPPSGATNGSIEFTINGETYRSRDDIGSKLAANGVYQFKSLTNPSNVVTFKVGTTAIQFDTADKAANFESALKNALGVGSGGASLKFQVGVTTEDTLSVRIDSVTTDKLGTHGLDVTTQDNAAAAADAIDVALGVVTSVRADVGALQSRFNFASANIESSIQNQDAARGVLLDTDIASESTSYATNQVKLQAGISVLAQANQQLQNLLKLIS